MTRVTLLIAASWLVAGATLPIPIRAADPDAGPVEAALGREILDRGRPLAEIQDYIEARVPRIPEFRSEAEARAAFDAMRAETLKEVVFRGKAAAWRDAKTRVEWVGEIGPGPGYRIKKLRYEALPGLWIPALLYEPDRLEGRVPAVLNVNGHDADGKAAPYKQIRCINLAKRGMLALNVEWLGMGQLRSDGYDHGLINAIDLCGSGGIATHYLAMTRALDLLLGHEHADPARVAVTGLSGGGWQTIFVSALDPRVKLSVPVAGYSSFRTRVRHLSDLGDSEQTPCDLATVTDYAHLTAMLAPRPALLMYNAKDNCCFAADHALPPLIEAAAPIFALHGKPGNLRSHVNHDPGTHNYELDNRQAFYRMLGDHFLPNDRGYDSAEIPSDQEVQTREQLNVPLPEDRTDLAGLALALSRSLPRDPEFPTNRAEAGQWQRSRRDKLRDVVRARDYAVQAESAGESTGPMTSKAWRLKVGEGWTVPAVELENGKPEGTAILVVDGGRKAGAAVAQELLSAGHRVLAVDPFLIGESHIEQREYLWALLAGTVGDRPLGLQASEIAAIARWARAGRAGAPVKVVAIGRRSSLAALVAAGIEPEAIGGLELRGAPGSLKELIEQKTPYLKWPEAFCFGLLEVCDIKQLAALVAPRPVAFRESSDRLKSEMSGLKAWYATLGADFEPAR